MRWRPGYIEIGKTQLVSSHVFLSANVPNLPEITNGISIKTQNTNMDGMWRFYDLPGHWNIHFSFVFGFLGSDQTIHWYFSQKFVILIFTAYPNTPDPPSFSLYLLIIRGVYDTIAWKTSFNCSYIYDTLCNPCAQFVTYKYTIE